MISKRWFLSLSIIIVVCCSPMSSAAEPLPSWNDGTAKQRIITFVTEAIEPNSPGYIAPSERIAVFDNDGTLWPENPLPFQLAFALDELKRLRGDHPEWKQDELIQAAINGNIAAVVKSGHEGLLKIIDASHSEMPTTEFEERVAHWIQTAKHPRYGRRFDRLGYQPMLEVLHYLRANGFQTWIVSGGGVDFMRVWAEEAYGIPPQQIIGTRINTRFEIVDGQPRLLKQPGIEFVDDKAGKPVAIHHQIGRRPVACFGNSDGDLQMLQWTTIDHSPSLGVIIHHTDAEREYAYDRSPGSSGKLIDGLDQAEQHGWVVVDMKADWKRVFSD